MKAAATVSTRLGLPVLPYRFGVGLTEPENRWSAAFGITSDGAVLVRPDGFVSWRSTSRSGEPAAVLERVLAGMLARS